MPDPAPTSNSDLASTSELDSDPTSDPASTSELDPVPTSDSHPASTPNPDLSWTNFRWKLFAEPGLAAIF